MSPAGTSLDHYRRWHGGMDGGAVGYNNLLEKDINLAITEDLRDLFDQRV